MKKTKYFVIGALALSIGMLKAYAAPTHSISVSRGTIENGQSVNATVTVKNAASWHVVINGTGNTNGCSLNEADASSNGKNTTKNFTVTCKSNSTGIIKINYMGDATSEDGSVVNLSGSKTVTVIAPVPKSTNNYLNSLGVEGTTISPDFNKETLEYTAVVEAGTEKINITAEKSDNKASITGIGERDVVEGENVFEVTVTSESGSPRTYILKVTVKEFDPIIVTINNKEYTVVRKLDQLPKKDGWVETTVTIDENDVPALSNAALGITVVGIKDENGTISFAIYKDGKYEPYYQFNFEELSLQFLKMKKSLLPKEYKKFEVAILGEVVDGYKLKKSSNYALIYAADVKTGEKNLYQVDLKNGTAQIYNKEITDLINDTNHKSMIITFIISGILGFIIIVEYIALLLSKGKKKKIVNKIKEEKIEKVKEEAIKDAEKDVLHTEEIEKIKTKKSKK